MTADGNGRRQNAKRDWEAIRTEYVTGAASLRDLASKHEIALASIGSASARDSWNEQREQYRTKIAQESQEIIAAQEIDARVLAARLAREMTDKYLVNLRRMDAPAPGSGEIIDVLRIFAVLQGYAGSRHEEIVKDWRDVAKGLGVKPEDVLAEFERVAASTQSGVDTNGAADSGAQRANS